MTKYIKLLGFLFFVFLSGCASDIPYDKDLFKANPENCWPCLMYMKAFQTLDSVLDNALGTVAQNSLEVLKLSLLFWLLFKVGHLVVSLAEPDMKKEFSTLVTVLFKALIVAILLNNTGFIYELFGATIIQPLGEIFLSMSDMILSSPSQVGIDNINALATTDFLTNLTSFFNKLMGNDAYSSKMFGKLAISVLQVVFKIYDALWHGMGLGFQLFLEKDFSATIAGIILIFGMFWLLLIIPLFFVDAFMRIGLILILLPLLLVGWVFSFPKGLVKKVFHSIFAGFFDILFNAIYITFLVSMFRVYENQKLPYLLSTSYQTTESSLRNSGKTFSTDYVILIALVFCMLALAKSVSKITSFFFEGAGESSIIQTFNKIKNFTMQGLRVGLTILSGPVGWATGAVKASAGALQNAASGETNTEKQEENDGGQQKTENEKQSNPRNSQKPDSGRRTFSGGGNK